MNVNTFGMRNKSNKTILINIQACYVFPYILNVMPPLRTCMLCDYPAYMYVKYSRCVHYVMYSPHRYMYLVCSPISAYMYIMCSPDICIHVSHVFLLFPPISAFKTLYSTCHQRWYPPNSSWFVTHIVHQSSSFTRSKEFQDVRYFESLLDWDPNILSQSIANEILYIMISI